MASSFYFGVRSLGIHASAAAEVEKEVHSANIRKTRLEHDLTGHTHAIVGLDPFPAKVDRSTRPM